MPIKQSVLKDCPKIKDGTINATAFRMLDEEDYQVLFSIKDICASGCIMRCCNGRYVDCETFRKWAKKNKRSKLLERKPETMKKHYSQIEREE